ncbi:MAG: DinB family protein [Flavobacteriales bacterium]|nr:DinB family protein [Flavobacteriales bacterium]
MKDQKEFLQQYASEVRNIIREMESWSHQEENNLQRYPAPGKWSAIQCVQHLNVYSRYYLKAIEKELKTAPTVSGHEVKSGPLGRYFIKLMKTNDNGIVTKPMNSPKNAVPELLPNVKSEISEFIQHQQKLLILLQQSEKIDINQIRIPTSIMKMIRMKLGDTFAFFIEHEKRHMIQGRKALEAGESRL